MSSSFVKGEVKSESFQLIKQKSVKIEKKKKLHEQREKIGDNLKFTLGLLLYRSVYFVPSYFVSVRFFFSTVIGSTKMEGKKLGK